MKSVCVYLGANSGTSPRLAHVAHSLGQEIARRGLRLIYGGSRVGLMGVLAQAVIANGGQVVGIIPNILLSQEKAHPDLNQLIVVETMQERKQLMHQYADAFIVMPGGLGTLEEALETWSAIKIGLIDKPLGFLNIEGFYDGLFSFVSHCQHQGFLTPRQSAIPILSDEPIKLLDALFATYGQATLN